MAELADARGSGPRSRKGVEVRVLFSAPKFESTRKQRARFESSLQHQSFLIHAARAWIFRCGIWLANSRLLCRLLIQPDDIAARIKKSCGDLGSIATDRLNDLSSIREDGVEYGGYVVDHDVDQKTGFSSWQPAEQPGSADLSCCVIEGGSGIAGPSYVPSEDVLVKRGGGANVLRGHLDVANLAVSWCWNQGGAPLEEPKRESSSRIVFLRGDLQEICATPASRCRILRRRFPL